MWEGALMAPTESCVILDACCLINLYATGRCAEILTVLPHTFAAGREALEEANYLARKLDDGTYEREEIEWRPLTERKLITVLELGAETEEHLFVDLSVTLDDGEAATLAIAIHRGYTVATDEKKATNLVRDEFPQCPITNTLALLKEWEQIARPTRTELTEAIQNVRDLAHYQPGPGHDLYEWWTSRI